MQIYLISNKINGKNYVGQTIWNFQDRYHGKWWDFTHNRHLKESAKKYGHENFDIKILWEGICSTDELTVLEDRYIKEYNCITPNGYNKKDAGKRGRNYYNFKEYELVDSEGIIYKISNLSQFCKSRGFNYGAILNMVSGRSFCSFGFALSSTDISKIEKQDWELEKIKTGEVFKLNRFGVEDFCNKMGLKTTLIWSVLRGRICVSQGYKLKSTILSGNIKEKKTKYEKIELVNVKTGEIITTDNIYKFCKDRNIDRGSIYDLINHKAIVVFDWKLSSTKNEREELMSRLGLDIVLLNLKTNKKISVKNISDFCRKEGLNINVMHSMIAGTILQYNFWTIPNRDLTNYKFPKKIIYIEMINNDTGEIIRAKNPKEIQNKYKICCSAYISDVIRGKYKNNIKGWSIKLAKFLNNYYSDFIA